MSAAPARAREALIRVRLVVRGAVQGVGFRPFVFRLARELGLTGWVENTKDGVVIEAQGPVTVIAGLAEHIYARAPRHARIDGMEQVLVATCEPAYPAYDDQHDFVIRPSGPRVLGVLGVPGMPGIGENSEIDDGAPATIALPDLAVCTDCLADIWDSGNRRYRYPFISCTQCGPRYSILLALPYDRARTTMARFDMCPACRAEYENPADRRFHAQPIACPACGPQLALWDGRGQVHATGDAAMAQALAVLGRGAIVAVKGLGGFQLMVDARDSEAVARLRVRKRRPEKPLAVLFPSLGQVRQSCIVHALEADILASAAAPIVLIERRPGAELAPEVAPGSMLCGAMLPYTPLHALLAEGMGAPLVATSGNVSEEPMCTDEHEALAQLGHIADWFLVHDRPIARPVDDSVVRVIDGRPVVFRRARGYAPMPVAVPEDVPVAGILGLGGQMKAAVAVGVPGAVVLGQHIGDLDHAAAREGLRRAVQDLAELHGIAVHTLACDMHPDYWTTRLAGQMANQLANTPAGARVHHVQHHHAHVLACMAENRLSGPVLGVSWDGTGYGADGTVWGGELVRARGARCERVGYLRQFRLPGGEAAVREPRRSALGVLYELYGENLRHVEELAPLAAFRPEERGVLLAALARGVQAPLTSSAGRLFDAAAALMGLMQRCGYEGQAAMALEQAAAQLPMRPMRMIDDSEHYPFRIVTESGQCLIARLPGRERRELGNWIIGNEALVLDWGPCMVALIADVRAGVAVDVMAARFQSTLAELIVETASVIGEPRVVLTGGCFQNRYLTETVNRRLRGRGMEPYGHSLVPPGDGGLALGQVMAAALAHCEEDGHVSGRTGADRSADR